MGTFIKYILEYRPVTLIHDRLLRSALLNVLGNMELVDSSGDQGSYYQKDLRFMLELIWSHQLGSLC